ncbi:multidrug ABC transporter ATP-binding protein [Bacteriovorax stolpii]|uniref:Multidrug ABC transporter ATP-binding protein n=1 Tax=Bacteriovorax stolpii TaxID=960 RepID=A0A2K9NUG8_BACTC|nr:ABC transporter transmembrane domain-containing protein [Bacteriovorax stolpii]AUN99138.1 multidrug ABC transporter ATP-binding protein [Bacteriovorax stolpii]TDP55330.1 ABC-type multidrug transport system fused ATPase/permease subunit [Bacteriovorax stolpii]
MVGLTTMLAALKNFFFFNVSPLVKKGRKKILTFEDLLPLPEELKLNRSLEVAPIDLSSQRTFISSLVGEQKKLVTRAWSFYVIGTLSSLSSPFFVNQFITRLTRLSEGSATYWEVLPIAVCIGLIGVMMGIGYQHNFYATLRANVLIVARLNRLIFEKALKLSQKARQNVNVGDVVNHMSTDTEALADVPMLIGDLGWATLLLIGSVSMLFYYLGWTALIAVAILAILTPVTRKIAKRFIHLEDEMMKKRDHRVTLMGQILQSMRLVKYYVWEEEISNQVSQVREEEVKARRSLAKVEMLSGLSFVAISTLVLFVALCVHVLRGEALTPALVLTCVSLFGLLQEPIGHLPGVLSRLINAWVSAKRIIGFLNSESVDGQVLSTNVQPIIFDHVFYQSEKGNFAFKDLSFSIAEGETVAIVGEVGSGKTTLLQLILQEIKPQSGAVSISRSTLGYVSQESYIMNATVLENLKMGKDVSEARVKEALYVTSMERDIKNLPGGLLTEIGEKGVNLSGGQKQRVSLGRCVIQDPDIVLLDDPLSAVDVNTEKALVNNLILGEWKKKTVIIATHRLEALAKFDRILFLEDGKVAALGTLSELLEQSESFKHFYSHHLEVHALEKDSELAASISGESDKTETRLMSDEDREEGAVKGSLYIDYIKALGGEGKHQRFIIAALVLGVLAISVFPLFNQWWLSWFSGHPTQITPIQGVMIYGLIALVSLIVQMSNQIFWLKRGIKAGVELHDRMLAAILRAPVRFFDTTPVGRLLQRFSRDLESVDIQLQWSFEAAVQALFQIVVSLSLIIVSVPLILVVIVPIGFVYWNLQILYRASAREAKRMDSIARSPRYAHFKETLGGLPVIRAYKKEAWFREQFFSHLEKSQQAFVNNFLLNRWFSIRIPMIGGLISGSTALCLIVSVYNGYLTAATAGLVILYSMSFWGALNWGIRILSDLESRMTSIERIRFMTRIPSEKRFVTSSPVVVDEAWPSEGRIHFSNVHARYDESLPEVVKGLDINIPPGAQVGIVGRTGAGKTTLFQMIYRFINVHKGKIEIDGVDIASIDLGTLRSRLAIIPQDPTLFMGTLRSNLDPYSRKSDEEIWKVLKDTGLEELVKGFPLGLLSAVSDGGANLSQGQRQLFCLARALLLNAKIIMLDEATASVDVVSDAKIQRVLRRELKGKTVLVIAHRLGTVADLDYLMVMNDGRLESFKAPNREFLEESSAELGLEEALEV